MASRRSNISTGWWDGVRARLAVIILATVVPIAVFELVQETLNRDHAVGMAIEEARRLDSAAAYSLKTALRAADSQLLALAELPALRALDRAACGDVLARIVAQDPRYAGLATFDRTGKPVCSAGRPPPPDVADQAWFQAALRAATGSAAAGQASVSFRPARPLLDPAGQAAGAIHAALDLDGFAERIAGLAGAPGVELVIADDRDGLLASYPPRPPSGGNLRAQAILAALAAAPPGGTAEAAGLDGVARIFSRLDLDTAPESASIHAAMGWAVAPIAAPIEGELIRHLLFMAGVTALMIAAGFIGGERLISRPLRALLRGNEPSPVAEAGRRAARPAGGEIGTLAAILAERAARLAEQKARLSETEILLRTVVDGVPLLIDVKDVEDRYVLVNAPLAALHGKPVGWFVGKRPSDLYPEGVGREIEARELGAIRSGTVLGPIETSYVDAAGRTTHWVENGVPIRDEAGAVRYLVCIALEVTELRRSQAALAVSEARLRSIVDHIPVTVVLKDLAGRYLLVNEIFRQRYRPPRDAIDLTAATVLPKAIADWVEAQDRRVLETRQPVEVEDEVTLADGRRRKVVRVAFPVLDGAGEAIAVGSLGLDVTEQRATEEKLRRAEAIQAIGRLTGGVAHEFNNLLAIILGRAELMTERPATERDVQAIIRAATRAADLTRRLRSFSRRQTLSPRPVDLRQLVAGMEVALRRILGDKIELRIREAPDQWLAMADPVRIEDALLNLVDNARDAMAAGGVLTIELGNFEATGPGAARRGQFAILAVGDSGEGMPPDVLARVFQPFFTTKPEGKGNGLGLATIHAFAEQSGGWVTIDSAEGSGTTVRLHLPRAAAAAAVAPALRRAAPPAAEPELILLVEDEADVREMAAQMLRDLGYRVLVAADGHQALALLEQTPGIDLLLSDVILTDDVDGVALARRAQRLQPGLPVLFMSGYTGTTRLAALEEGVNLISKPFHKAELGRMVRQALASPADRETRAG
jgi:PAS domain S-box-containing protein